MIVSLADRLKDVKAYYFVKKLEQIAELNRQGKDVISFGIGSPDMAPDTKAIEAMYETASQSNTHGYQPYRGIPAFREAIAEWYNRTYGIELNPANEVLPLMGSKEGILHVILAFVNPGDKILVPNPGYPTYASLSKLLGGEMVHYDLKEENGWYPDFDQLNALDTTGVKLMWVNYPHMPTGTPARRDIFERLIAFAKERKILICHDNPYSLVLNQDKPLSILAVPGAKDVAIELNSFSKSHNMAGWRVGMLVGAEEYLTPTLTVKSNIDSGMFLGIQKAAIEALNSPEDWHVQRNDIYRVRRDWVWKILDLLGFEYDKKQEGMFVWAKPKPASGITDIPEFIDDILLRKHVFFTPGMIFGSNGNGYLRASLCVSSSRMEEAYHRLLKQL